MHFQCPSATAARKSAFASYPTFLIAARVNVMRARSINSMRPNQACLTFPRYSYEISRQRLCARPYFVIHRCRAKIISIMHICRAFLTLVISGQSDHSFNIRRTKRYDRVDFLEMNDKSSNPNDK